MNEFVVMGVSGSGKSTVASILAARTNGIFLDADDFHAPENKARMAAGNPLTDNDRWPWLEALNQTLRSRARFDRPVFLACSALRQAYRDRLAAGLPQLRFIYLKGSIDLIGQRLQQRQNHFVSAALLESQFAILEEPTHAIIVSVGESVPEIVESVLKELPRASKALTQP